MANNVKRMKISKSTAANKDVIDFTTKSNRDELTLVVEGKHLYVSKALLSMASPVFNNMLTTEFKEKYQDEIELPGKTYNAVLELLKCIHPAVLKHVTMETVFGIIPLADEYLIHNLKSHCEAFLISNINKAPTAKNLCRFIDVAVKFEMRELEQKCMLKAGDLTGTHFKSHADKYKLPVQIREEIYRMICIKQSKLLRELKHLSFSENDLDFIKTKLRAIPDQ